MKKVLTLSIATLFIFLASGIVANINADEWTEKVVADKKFEINKNAKLVVDHEFGNVRCKNWNQNSISVKVTVKAKTKDAKKVQEIIDRVIVDVDGSKDNVTVECGLGNKNEKNKSINVTIDIDIYMPSTINLSLEHKFGTAFVESVSGPTKISSEYGSIEIGSLSNSDNELEVMFGEAQINSINKCKLEISYSQLKIQDSKDLSIESEYSDMSIDNSNSIKFELESGNVALGNVNKLDVESTFSNLEVLSLAESFKSEMEYGALEIKNVNKGFAFISIENTHGTVALNVSKSGSFKFAVEGEFLSFNYPKEYTSISEKSENNFETTIKGVVGKESNPTSVIKIESVYGSVNFIAK
ncbi:MAG TPA: hypothetical protein QF480_03570 [Bacteroidales bacterium]|jgi:hypothetical protein|nr:hypothetical protein [Bacteroidales bacterium]|tara:strand:- start:656 stop:1723 length:1068 start_codon:yes stop_codon:yes gene_type:complete